MPIDPSLSLQVRGMQPQDPMQSFGQALTLRNILQNNKLNEQGLEENRMKLSAMRQQIEDEQTARAILTETGGSFQSARDPLIRALGTRAMPVVKQLLEEEAALTKLSADQLRLGSDRFKRLSESAAAILAMPQEQRPIAYQRERQALIAQGLPQEQVDQMAPPEYPGDEFLQLAAFRMESVAANMARKHDEKIRGLTERKATAEAQTAEQTAAGKQPITPYQQETLGIQKRQLAVQEGKRTETEWAAMAARGDPQAKRVLLEIAAQKGREAAATQSAQFGGMGGLGAGGAVYTGSAPGVPVAHNDDALRGVPAGVAAQVRMMVEGRMPIPSGMALSRPYWQNMLRLAAEYEPGFDATQWRVRLDTRVDFAKGKAANNIRSLNTLVDHLGKLSDAINELDNSRFPYWNTVANWAIRQQGDPRVTKFKTAAQAVESEAVNVFKGTGATDQEIKEMRANFDENASPAQQFTAASTVMGLAFGRMYALESQYENAMHKPRDFRFLNEAARHVLRDKLKMNPDELDTPKGMGFRAPVPGDGSTQPPAAPGQTVKLQAPDGTIKDVPADQAEHYIQLGAKRVP